MENKTRRIARIVSNYQLSQHLFDGITDIRRHPAIGLRTILTSFFLMPFFSLTSLLSLDREARTQRFKSLFGCSRKIVASDSTLRRVLGWLDPQQLRTLLLKLLPLFERQGLLTTRLAPQAPQRRLGILDGSFMGGHWLSILCLSGRINLPALIAARTSQGDEMAVGLPLIRASKTLLGQAFPTLWLLDALYFTRPVFRLLRRLGAHLLIKLKEADYRQATQDAANLFQHFGGDREAKGFDLQRMCSWNIQQTTTSFAGFPVQVVHLQEFYPKRKTDQHVECWIITTQLSLSLEEIRQAAHLRWQIENNVFKRLNHLVGTKRFRVKDPRAFFNLLHLLCAAVAVLNALIDILSRHARIFKALLAGAKFTWRNLFARLAEACEEPLFAPH